MRPLTAFALAAVLAAGCAERPQIALPGEPGGSAMSPDQRARTLEAEARMDALDRRLEAAAQQPGERRLAAERALGPELEKTAEAVAGTRFENKAWYLVASWRYNYAPHGEGTDQALDRLMACRSTALKQAGGALRVQVLLRQGRVVQARREAVTLAAEVPEWRTLLDLVAFHERIGSPAPATTGMSVERGAVEVLADAPGAWRLLIFADALDDQAVAQVRRYQAVASARLRAYVLAADSGARIAAARVGELAGAEPLWADTQARLDAWRTDWGLPAGGAVVLIDPAGRIAAVQLAPEDLPGLLR